MREQARGAQPGEQAGLLRLGAGEVRVLDVAEAADLQRQQRKLDRDGVVGGRQAADDLVDHRLVLADQPAFGAALLAARENVEPGAAQPRSLASNRNTVSIHGPNSRLRKCPVRGSRSPRIGGAR